MPRKLELEGVPPPKPPVDFVSRCKERHPDVKGLCQECQNEYRRAWMEANPERGKVLTRRSRRNAKERAKELGACKDCGYRNPDRGRLCSPCAEKRAEYKRRRRAAGVAHNSA